MFDDFLSESMLATALKQLQQVREGGLGGGRFNHERRRRRIKVHWEKEEEEEVLLTAYGGEYFAKCCVISVAA